MARDHSPGGTVADHALTIKPDRPDEAAQFGMEPIVPQSNANLRLSRRAILRICCVFPISMVLPHSTFPIRNSWVLRGDDR